MKVVVPTTITPAAARASPRTTTVAVTPATRPAGASMASKAAAWTATRPPAGTTRMRQSCSGHRSAQAHAQQGNHRAFSQFSPFHERTTFFLIP
jgi:hypothetical protein